MLANKVSAIGVFKADLAISAMHEFNVDILAGKDGTFTLDVHESGSSGTSPTMEFSSLDRLEDFFRSLGMSGEQLTEIHNTGAQLLRGNAYHRMMFLPVSAAGELGG
jgi:hypothetical protein